MGAAEKKDEEAAVVEIPVMALERLVAELARQNELAAKHNELAAKQTHLLAQLVQTEERKLAQVEDNARRASRKTGPTTDEARAIVEKIHKRLGI